jgi:basic membrane protein A and related proteins
MRVSSLLHITLCISLCACGQLRDTHRRRSTTDRATASEHKSFKVALLTPGPISDQAWNAAAYRGLLRIRDSLGAQISNVETKTPAEFDENFRQYGAQGYSLVIANGFEYQDAVQSAAPDYPQTMYVTTSGDRTGQNWAGIDFRFEEGAYLAGLIAASVSKTGVIGTIGGTELPPVKRGFAGFAAGARSVNPRIRVLSSYVGNWDDASAAKEQALAQVTQGADVIFQNADAAGLGVFQAAKDSKGVWVIGSNSDQNGVAPAVTLASVVIDLPHALFMIGQQIRDGLFTPAVITLGAEQQVVKLAINPALGPEIPGVARVAVDSIQALQMTGRFVVPVDNSVSATASAPMAGPAAPVPAAAGDSVARK